jgi:hypothetical protein
MLPEVRAPVSKVAASVKEGLMAVAVWSSGYELLICTDKLYPCPPDGTKLEA